MPFALPQAPNPWPSLSERISLEYGLRARTRIWIVSKNENMDCEQERRWCLFTSAGDKNALRLWLNGDAPRRWDLVVAYYGDNDREFSNLSELSAYSYRIKGFKYQNLKNLVMDDPRFFDRYSHVWACDDDIVMSTSQINEAFELTENLGFWVAQPALLPRGRNSHWTGCFAGAQWDYRIVNFVENGLAIFRRDKLMEFLAVYDGSLAGWGIDYWYGNLFRADEFGRFAVIDKVRVINPRHQERGGGEIERRIPWQQREADWNKVRQKYGLVEYPLKIFAYCRLAPERQLIRLFLPIDEYPPIGLPHVEHLWRSGWRRSAGLLRDGLIVRALWQVVRRSGWRDAMWILRSGLTIRRIIFRLHLRSALARHYARAQASLSLAGGRAARLTGFWRQLR
jgi:hypothetical protein